MPSPRVRPLTALWVLLCLSLSAQSQTPLRFESLSLKEGLSQSTVLAILQDHRGYLWVGTEEGLNRYDGTGFTVFKQDPLNPHALKNAFIHVLYEQEPNKIWVGAEGGLALMETGQETRFTHKIDAFITAIAGDGAGGLWVGARDHGLLHINAKGELDHDLSVSRASRKAGVLALPPGSPDQEDRHTPQKAGFLTPPAQPKKVGVLALPNQEMPHSQTPQKVGVLALRHTPQKAGFLTSPAQPKKVGVLALLALPNQEMSYSQTPQKVGVLALPDQEMPDPQTPEKVGVLAQTQPQKVGVLAQTLAQTPAQPKKVGVLAQTLAQTPAQPKKVGVLALCLSRDNRLWVGWESGGLEYLDPGETETRDFGENRPFQKMAVTALFEDSGGALWVGTRQHGLFRIKGEGQLSHFGPEQGLASTSINVIGEDLEGTLWIGSEGDGLSSFDGSKFTTWMHNPKDPKSLSENTVRALCTDRSGLLWIGAKGLDKLRPLPFHHYQHDPNNPNTLSNNIIRAVLEDEKGRLWVGATLGGLNLINRETGRVDRFRQNPKDPHSLNSDHVLCLLEDQDQTLWVGTMAGLARRDAHQFRSFLLDPSDPAARANVVRTLAQGDEKSIMVGGDDGLFRFSPETGIAHRVVDWNPVIRVLYRDRRDRLWIGGDDGLARLDGQQITHWRYDPQKKNQLSAPRVLAILEDGRGVLWVGASSGGLNRLDPITGTFTHFQEKDGLPNNVVYGILEDPSGDLWISTNRGLSHFNPNTLVFRNYDAGDGLLSDEFNTGACFRTTKGELFFGGINGLISFFSDQVKVNANPPPLVISQFQILNTPVLNTDRNAHGKPILNGVLGEGGSLALTRAENAFSFEFAALEYTAPHKNQYAHKMENFDGDWVFSKRRFANYTNLDPGNYVFKVKAANNDGVWNQEGIQVPIHIATPLYKTVPAYVAYIVIFAFILYGLRRYELNRKLLLNELKWERLVSEKLQEMDNMKSRFFANISHEFRTPLTLILGPLKRIQDTSFKGDPKKYYQMMEANGQRLLRLINQLLDLSKLEDGRLKLKACDGDVVRDLRLISDAFAARAENRKIQFQFLPEQESLALYYDRDKLEKIVYNLLSNAFKFTPPGGRIQLSVRETTREATRYCVVEVCDTGPGVPEDQIPRIFDRFFQLDAHQAAGQAGSGIGLALARELTLLHHGEITVSSKPNEQTIFSVYLPMGADHLQAGEIGTEPEPEQPLGPPIEPQPIAAHSLPEEDAERMLIVEDHPEVRDFLKEAFGSRYRVSEARNGEQGLEIAMQTIPDIIVSDVMMPGLDGLEMCRKLKSDEKTSHIPIILLTARANRKARVQGLETGADAYMVKPVDLEELEIRIRELLRQRQQLRERNASAVQEEVQNSADTRFLQRASETVEQHLADPQFSVLKFSHELAMSRVQLYRKIKAITGKSPGDFIRSQRLKQAARLLKERQGTVAEITFQVGFNDPSYFSKCFRKHYGVSPTEYIAE